MAVTLRSIAPEDMPLLQRVYACTRTDILAVNWDEPQKHAFLDMQFNAQHSYYQIQFPTADYLIIEQDGQAIGRLYVDRRPTRIHVLDIALLPEARGTGIGTRLLQDLMEEGARTGRDVTLYVERENVVRQLYQRLDFHPVEEQGIYILMEWKCAAPSAK